MGARSDIQHQSRPEAGDANTAGMTHASINNTVGAASQQVGSQRLAFLIAIRIVAVIELGAATDVVKLTIKVG